MDIIRSSNFKKDLKRLEKSGNIPRNFKENLEEILNCFSSEIILKRKYQDHPLKGDYADFRDCHVCSDLVMIYKKENTKITLRRLISHSDLLRKKNPGIR